MLRLVREAFRSGAPWDKNAGNPSAMRQAMAAAVLAVEDEGVPWGWVRRDPFWTAAEGAAVRGDRCR